MSKQKWSENDINFLIKNYHKKSVNEISKIINRSVSCIKTKVFRLNIKKDKKWSDKEVKFLMDNYKSYGLTYCSTELGKTKCSVNRKAIEFKLKSGFIKRKILKDRLLNGIIEFECKKHGKVNFYIRSKNRSMTPECMLCKRESGNRYYHKNSKSLLFMYKTRIRNSIRDNFNRISRGGGVSRGCFRHLNYSPMELYNHLEKIRKNQNNCCPMCYISYNIKSFDIDHIIPLKTAKTIEQVKKLFELNNLSLLCFYCNRWIKRGKV